VFVQIYDYPITLFVPAGHAAADAVFLTAITIALETCRTQYQGSCPALPTGRMLHPESLPGTGRYHPSDEG